MGGWLVLLILGQLGGQAEAPGGLPYEHLSTPENSFDNLATPGLDLEREPIAGGSLERTPKTHSGLSRV